MSVASKKSDSGDKIVTVDDKTVLVAGDAGDCTVNLVESQTAAPPELPTNSIFIAERYEVLEQIGAGGMATVFKVRHIHLNRLEALVLRAMAKAPTDRYQHILELSSDLKSLEMRPLGPFGRVVSLFKVNFARMKAAERKTVVLKSSLQVVSLLSVIISLGLFFLPPHIRNSNTAVTRNDQIILLTKLIQDMENT